MRTKDKSDKRTKDKDDKRAKDKGVKFVTIVSLCTSITLAVGLFFAMHFAKSQFLGNETSVYIACISIVASTIGLSVTAFIFLNDSLKKRAEANKSLSRVVSAAINYKYKELLAVSVVSIVCIVLSIFGNSLKTGNRAYYPLLRANFALTVGIVVYIIILSASNISSAKVIAKTACTVSKKNRTVLVKECETYFANVPSPENLLNGTTGAERNAWPYVQKEIEEGRVIDGSALDFKDHFYNMPDDKCQMILNLVCQERAFELAYRRYLITNNQINNPKSPESDEVTITDFAKIVNQIDVIIKTLCRNNIDRTIVDDMTRIKEGLSWLFCDIKEYQEGKEFVDKQDSDRLLDFMHYMLIVYTDEYFIRGEKEEDAKRDAKAKREEIFRTLRDAFDTTGGNEQERLHNQKRLVDAYKKVNQNVIEQLVSAYDLLLNYQEALMVHDTGSGNQKVPRKIYHLANTILHILLDRFCGFVRLGTWNMGGSSFNKAWMNCSDLSNSSFVNSNFKYAHFENGIMKDSDLSVSTFERAHLQHANFEASNLNYCNFKGAICRHVDFSNCLMDGAIFGPFGDEKGKKSIKGIQPKVNEIIQCIEKADGSWSFAGLRAKSNQELAQSGRRLLIEDVKNATAQIDAIVPLPNEKGVRQGSGEQSENYADLRNATIDNVVLTDVDFSGVALAGASFKKSVLTSAFVGHTDCSGSNFNGANLAKGCFYDVGLHESVMSGANLFNAKFINVQGERINAESASLMSAIIASAATPQSGALGVQEDKEEAGNFHSVLVDCNLRNAMVVDAIVLNTNLDQSTWDLANIKRGIFCNSLLRWTSLVGADLSQGILFGCSLYQANMKEAKLPRGYISHCDISNANLDNVILLQSNVQKCLFVQASFIHTNLSNTKFNSCYFCEAMFKGAIFLDTKFERCVFCDMEVPSDILSAETVRKALGKLPEDNYLASFTDKDTGNTFYKVRLAHDKR